MAAEIAADTLRGLMRLVSRLSSFMMRSTARLGVARVVDGESALVSEHVGVRAQHAQARGVERRDPHVLGVLAHQVHHAPAHLVGGLVGEGDGHDLVGPRVAGGEEVRDAPGQDPRLARSGAGDHQQGTAALDHGASLGFGQSLEETVGVQALARSPRRRGPTATSSEKDTPAHSHSMVPGGLDVTSRATRLTPGTSRINRLAIDSMTS